jgi:hypothetical protein
MLDAKTNELLKQWRLSLTDRERALHDFAAVQLKKSLNPNPSDASDGDNGSYFPEKCHAFKQWLKGQQPLQQPQQQKSQ